ncbi:MAG: mitochondrial fission ELM1 family protein [Pontiellaceae bacterium]|nr:mitochondrial fission ELM1 family protein [Pontiellaceae bacterium]
MKRALIISDQKPGHVNQSIALCKHLGMDYEVLNVAYKSRFTKALSYLLDRLGIYTEKLFTHSDFKFQVSALKFQVSDFNLIVSAGSTTYYPNKLLARKLALPNIAILHPKGYRLDFTQILCPAYDHPPKRRNITELPLNLCAADPAFFAEKTDEFTARHTPQKKAVGFIIGGDNAVSKMEPEALQKKLEQLFALTEGSERWVTTSRRTPAEVEALIESMPFDYTLINSRDSYNPIPAFIQLCERLVVTSDSASMISECASFGTASVDVLMNRQLKTPNKFEELIYGLQKQNAVHIFDGSLGSADQKIDLAPLLSVCSKIKSDPADIKAPGS